MMKTSIAWPFLSKASCLLDKQKKAMSPAKQCNRLKLPADLELPPVL